MAQWTAELEAFEEASDDSVTVSFGNARISLFVDALVMETTAQDTGRVPGRACTKLVFFSYIFAGLDLVMIFNRKIFSLFLIRISAIFNEIVICTCTRCF
jgi:hypothetical protein